jgi:superfamily I DNA/RNA helicase
MKWLPESPISANDLASLRAALVPALAFDRLLRRGGHDPGLGERQRLRTVLDVEQSMAATGRVKDVLMILGPPGSGKTLVLAGRARLLATQHPDWRIALLCFNNALVPYLRQLVADHPQIDVNTFGKFAHGLGHRLSLDSEAEAERDYNRAKAKGIAPSIDALLIDEVQDFYPGWLRFALSALRDGRGGAVLAGDAEQALYRDAVSYSFLADRLVDHLTLTRAYRGTRQILDAALATVSRPQVGTDDEIPDGEQVELVWADSWNSQAEVVAWEARRLLDSGERDPADIGILVTQRQGILNRLKSVLAEVGVPYLIIDRDNAATFDPSSHTVKVMTVHAAEGHEFGVVILFGLEALPRPEDDDKARRGRVGFVGMTRARDQLILTYTRDNVYLDRLRRCPQVRTWTWPDDYEV